MDVVWGVPPLLKGQNRGARSWEVWVAPMAVEAGGWGGYLEEGRGQT